MTTRPNAKNWTIKEQILEDAVTGLSLQFEVSPNGERRLKIFGNLPFGNRDFIFDQEGEEAGAGTALTGFCQATWIREVVD